MRQGYSSAPRRFAFTLVSAALLGAASTAAAQPSFTEMTQSSPFRAFGGEMVTDVSYDGRTVVYSGDTVVDQGFVFSFDGFDPAGAPPTIQLGACQGDGDVTHGRGLSGDGEFAVGGCTTASAFATFQAAVSDNLTGNAGMDPSDPALVIPGGWHFGVNALGGLTQPPPTPVAEAQGANFDASVIVGSSANIGAASEGFAWFGDAAAAAGVMQPLGFLAGDTTSRALDVSGGGAFGDIVIAGESSDATSEAVIWTWDGTLDGAMNPVVSGPFGLSDLAHRDNQGKRNPLIPDGMPPVTSTAWGVSADGSHVVGDSIASSSPATRRAFLYAPSQTADPLDDTMIGLGAPRRAAPWRSPSWKARS